MGIQVFDDGSSIQTFDDGSTLATSTDGATTASNATDVTTVTDSSPASSISGAVSDAATSVGNAVSSAADAVSGAIGSVVGGVTKLLGAIGSNFGQGAAQQIPNPLHDYASYNYVISLGCLDTKSYNFPLTSYLRGKLPPLIFKSGSIDPNNRINSAWGKNEFYLESLKVNGQYGFQKSSGNTNTTNVEFSIIEPYSMGEFLSVCQQAAYQQGYSNYTEAPYLLMIEFYGVHQNGQMGQIPNTKKFIPIRFNKMEMRVTAAGAHYACEGYVYNSHGLTTEYNQLKSTATITGKTVQEILQTGQRSLQTVLNSRLSEQKKEKGTSVQDEILILFPANVASSASGALLGTAGANSTKEDKTGATIDPKALINDPTLFQQLGVSRDTATKTLIQGTGATNVLGKSTMNYSDLLNAKDKPIVSTDKMLDSAGNYVQSKVVATPGYVDMKFTKNLTVVHVINQVLLRSKYATDALNQPPDVNGFRPWWRIDVQVYHSTDKSGNPITGTVPKLVVYRVVPYKVHASKLIAPGTPPPGIAALKKQVAKVYDYIYSGKNVDILKFDFVMNQSWFQMGSSDLGNKSGDAKTKSEIASEDNDKNKKTNSVIIPKGGQTPVNSIPGQTSYSANSFSTDKHTGSRGDTVETKVAREWHEALIDGSDLQNITMEIIGDPYYIANSGMGNFTDSAQTINITKGGDINYQDSEVDIVINFRTPLDINQSTGLYNFGNTKILNQFSGLFKLVNLVSTFKDGKFLQSIEGYRRKQQDLQGASNKDALPTAKTGIGNMNSASLAPTGSNTATASPSGAAAGGGGTPTSAVGISAALASGQLSPLQARDAIIAQRAAAKEKAQQAAEQQASAAQSTDQTKG
jgi:hypothetical protein